MNTPADQIIDKTLYARTAVKLFRYPGASTPIATVAAGDVVGVVYSWVLRSGVIWWMFMDGHGAAYYAEHKPGVFDWQTLRRQGVQTTEEILEAQRNANTPLEDKILESAKWIAIVGISIYAGIQIIPALIHNKGRS